MFIPDNKIENGEIDGSSPTKPTKLKNPIIIGWDRKNKKQTLFNMENLVFEQYQRLFEINMSFIIIRENSKYIGDRILISEELKVISNIEIVKKMHTI